MIVVCFEPDLIRSFEPSTVRVKSALWNLRTPSNRSMSGIAICPVPSATMLKCESDVLPSRTREVVVQRSSLNSRTQAETCDCGLPATTWGRFVNSSSRANPVFDTVIVNFHHLFLIFKQALQSGLESVKFSLLSVIGTNPRHRTI